MTHARRHRSSDPKSHPVELLEPRRLLSTVRAASHGGGCSCGVCSAIRSAAADPAEKAIVESLKLNRIFDRSVSLVDAFAPLTSISSPRPDAVSYIQPNRFTPFAVDFTQLIATLDLAPLEFTASASNPLRVVIPAPDGSMQRFDLVESPIMEPELAAQFPDIRTFSGQGVDDPAATIRLDHTMHGFHAQVLSPDGSWYIDPYWHLDTSVHISYFKRDLPMREDQLAFSCRPFDDKTTVEPQLENVPPTAAERSGTQLRTYRLANAATGEYTQFHGGTVAAGQAAIVTAINRVNQVYERDLSIRLTLVANNSSLVYTNYATDPYSNSNGSAMLSQNQATIDGIIGSANYDIGHVFSTGGGGVAYLRSVGVNGIKAGGVTGLPAPTGDPFYIDYVAHEMGHQFGANHSFNTNNVGQRNSSTAYEPGSGSTIMSYAGITGASADVQSNADAMFHSISFDEILSWVDGSIPSVGTRTATGNSVPTVTAPSTRTIPASTPFELTATASDANGDSLTYSWEQRDLGDAENLNDADDGNGPLFRTYLPSSSPTRSFPRLLSVLSGANSTASPSGSSYLVERLPAVSRNPMRFRVTVRDNRAGGGGVNTADVNLVVVNTGASFAITNFNSTTSVTGGTLQTITWNVAGTTASGINAANVDILLSTDGGNTFPITLASATPNDGAQQVQVPYDLATTQARIKIKPTDNYFFDINNANFTIVYAAAPSATPGAPVLTAASDTGLSNSDGLTRLNNADPSRVLSFSVPGTVAGATVALYANGTLVGSTIASGTTTVVTTNGSTSIADGLVNFTARQTEIGRPQSPDSAIAPVTIDTVAPTGSLFTVSPNPRVTDVASVGMIFSETVGLVDVSDFQLTRDSGSNLLPGSAGVIGSDTIWSLDGLSSLTSAKGTYSLALQPPVGGLIDVAGNDLLPVAPVGWQRFILGDMNDDGEVTNQDIAAFVQALTDPSGYAVAYPQVPMPLVGDVNGDSLFDNQDIAAFVSLLTGRRPMSDATPRASPLRAPGRSAVRSSLFSDQLVGDLLTPNTTPSILPA